MSQSVKIEFAALGSLSGEGRRQARKTTGKTQGSSGAGIFTNADFEFGARDREP